MAHSITVRLNKPAREFQAGGKYRIQHPCWRSVLRSPDKKKEWTNYSTVVFAKPGAQADYYRSVLVEVALWKLPEKTSGLMFIRGKMVNPSLLNY